MKVNPTLPPSSLLALGASARAASSSAHRAACPSIAAIDLFADADLRRIAQTRRIADYPAEFERVFDELPGDVWLYTGGLENYPELVDSLAKRRPLAGNAGRGLRLVRDPFWLADVLSTAGFRFPRTVRTRGETSNDSGWLKKPFQGSAGLGISRVSGSSMKARSVSDGERAFASSLANASGFHRLADASGFHRETRHYYQQLIPGTPCSAVFVAAGSKSLLLGATRQLIGPPWTNAGPFVYAGNIGPLWEGEATGLTELGDLVAARAGLVGLFGVDFLLHEGEAWVLEVNPRYPASLEVLERAAGVPLLTNHLAACLRGELLPPPRFGPGTLCHGKAVQYARERLVVSEDQAARWLAAASGPDPLVADIPAAGTVIEKGQPVLTRFAVGGTMEEVEQQLRSAKESRAE